MTPLEQLLIQKIDCLRAPKEVKDAMVWALVDGKCFRGNLTHAAALAWGADDAMGMELACAIEAAHACSLVHDDLPAMDNDLMRRGKLTVHAKFGEAVAVLAGDALISLAYQWLGDCHHPNAAQMVSALGFAFGPEGMIGGQWFDLYAKVTDKQTLFDIHELKTGRLFGLCLVLGYLCAHPKVDETIWQLGRSLGVAYQCIDDFADVAQDDIASAPDFMSRDELMQLLDEQEAQVTDWLKLNCPQPDLVLRQVQKIFMAIDHV